MRRNVAASLQAGRLIPPRSGIPEPEEPLRITEVVLPPQEGSEGLLELLAIQASEEPRRLIQAVADPTHNSRTCCATLGARGTDHESFFGDLSNAAQDRSLTRSERRAFPQPKPSVGGPWTPKSTGGYGRARRRHRPLALTSRSEQSVHVDDVQGCFACDLSRGRLHLSGGLVHHTEHWLVEHCTGPLGVGTLIVKPERHVVHVADPRRGHQGRSTRRDRAEGSVAGDGRLVPAAIVLMLKAGQSQVAMTNSPDECACATMTPFFTMAHEIPPVPLI